MHTTSHLTTRMCECPSYLLSYARKRTGKAWKTQRSFDRISQSPNPLTPSFDSSQNMQRVSPDRLNTHRLFAPKLNLLEISPAVQRQARTVAPDAPANTDLLS
ncbi:hypothetical protein I7I48_11675 [Histoplasma ohiense]|nr:hypothetical protein I7I48_11675 [Histoplasma ohiense (nom. inval.)]